MVILYDKDTAREMIIQGGKTEYWKIFRKYKKYMNKLYKQLLSYPDYSVDKLEELFREMEENWIMPEGWADEKIKELNDEIMFPNKYKEWVDKSKEKVKQKFRWKKK